MKKNMVAREYFKISELSEYSGISERTLRELLKDPVNPIPFYRVGAAGRIIRVKKSDFDHWMQSQKAHQSIEIDALIADVIIGTEEG